MARRKWDNEGTKSKLYGRRWREYRERFLASHPLCAMCEKDGKVRAATVVDHIEDHKGDVGLFWPA